MCEEREKIEATIQISIGTCKKYVDDWELLCDDLHLDYYCLANGMNPDWQVNLTLEQAKTHGII